MKIFLFILAFVLQAFTVVINGHDPAALILTGGLLTISILLSLLSIIKYKSIIAILPLLTGAYLLFGFVYWLFTVYPNLHDYI